MFDAISSILPSLSSFLPKKVPHESLCPPDQTTPVFGGSRRALFPSLVFLPYSRILLEWVSLLALLSEISFDPQSLHCENTHHQSTLQMDREFDQCWSTSKEDFLTDNNVNSISIQVILLATESEVNVVDTQDFLLAPVQECAKVAEVKNLLSNTSPEPCSEAFLVYLMCTKNLVAWFRRWRWKLTRRRRKWL